MPVAVTLTAFDEAVVAVKALLDHVSVFEHAGTIKAQLKAEVAVLLRAAEVVDLAAVSDGTQASEN